MSNRSKRTQKPGGRPRLNFEGALARLEEIAQRLEAGELALEEAISLAEEGLKLSQFCEQQLTQAEGKIERLVERMGAVETEPLETDTGEEEQEED